MAKILREPVKKTIGQVVGSGQEARDRAKFDQERRNRKDTVQRVILLPKELETGQWSADKVLKTTLGLGKGTRALTLQDLAVFKHNMDLLTQKFGVMPSTGNAQARFLPGLTAKQIIAYALESRRERAREEIHAGVPVSGNVQNAAGATPSAVVRFLTNAGPKCRHKPARHHVTVEFINYYSAVNNVSLAAGAGAKWLTGLPLRFDCDCEDHTFRFRYIASIGGFAYGRAETGYPKERNPHLEGVACKHVIRVMQQIDSSVYVTRFLTTMIERSRKSKAGKGQARTSQQNAEAIFKRQIGKPSKIKVELAKVLKRAEKEMPKQKPGRESNRAVAKNLDKERRLDIVRQQLMARGMKPSDIDYVIDVNRKTML